MTILSNSDEFAVGYSYSNDFSNLYGSIFSNGQLVNINMILNGDYNGYISSIRKVSESGYLIADGRTGSVLLSRTPIHLVPEPTTYAMLLAGLGLVGFAARRNRQAV